MSGGCCALLSINRFGGPPTILPLISRYYRYSPASKGAKKSVTTCKPRAGEKRGSVTCLGSRCTEALSGLEKAEPIQKFVSVYLPRLQINIRESGDTFVPWSLPIIVMCVNAQIVLLVVFRTLNNIEYHVDKLPRLMSQLLSPNPESDISM
ncbi:hypothetical protein K449DRAFT_401921 [Hypoxylon sp. EC38]|nr:hypothetical protein K449DRAFT_401921 [Hypoxylon sp. EC38]